MKSENKQKPTLKAIFIASVIASFCAPVTRAETISLYDDTFSVRVGTTTLPTSEPMFSALWGTWNATTLAFAPIVAISSSNTGYVDLSSPELSVAINQTSNANISAGSQLSLAIYRVALQTVGGNALSGNYSSSATMAVLTDLAWVVPAFANNANPVPFTFTSNTSALVGSYSFNGGNEIVTLIPEPSSMSLMVIGLASVLAFRRKTLVKRGKCD